MKAAPVPIASALVYDAFVILPIAVAFLLWLFHRRARVEVRGGGPSALAFGVGMFLWLWATGGYLWLPTILVATAIVLHIAIARALRAANKSEA